MLGHKKEENKAHKDGKQAPLSTDTKENTFSADQGKGLPPQADNLNPNRAK